MVLGGKKSKIMTVLKAFLFLGNVKVSNSKYFISSYQDNHLNYE